MLPKFNGSTLISSNNVVPLGQWFTIYAPSITLKTDTASFFNLDWFKNGVLDTSTIAYSGHINYPLTLKKNTSTSDSFFVVLSRKGFICCVPDTSKTIIIQGVNGINDPYSSTEVAIYPNPSSGLFTVSTFEPINSLSISNMLGKEIITIKPNTNQTEIDLRGKAPGIYFYTLSIGEKKLRGKLVME
ncbi:MAG: T9SS type A sorting domain-containing protein [Bacteroidetes bacterium]|nr:T9SS type A sorting domain-containing protein [Bacteroidota bacterium]